LYPLPLSICFEGVKLLLKMGWSRGRSIKDSHTDALYGMFSHCHFCHLNSRIPFCTYSVFWYKFIKYAGHGGIFSPTSPGDMIIGYVWPSSFLAYLLFKSSWAKYSIKKSYKKKLIEWIYEAFVKDGGRNFLNTCVELFLGHFVESQQATFFILWNTILFMDLTESVSFILTFFDQVEQ
jgi:hypothetical protein